MQANHPKTIQELLALPEEFDERLQIPTRGYLFHGSPRGDIELLEPRQANHSGEPDGEPAICASDSFWDSMFKGIYNAHHLPVPEKYKSGWSNDGSNLSYYSTENLSKAAKGATAHLYLLDPTDFKWVDLGLGSDDKPRRELRSMKPVLPLTKIDFNLSDFPHQVEIIES